MGKTLSDLLSLNSDKVYEFAKRNTKYNSNNRPVIPKDDEWRNETEWDELYQSLLPSKKGVVK